MYNDDFLELAYLELRECLAALGLDDLTEDLEEAVRFVRKRRGPKARRAKLKRRRYYRRNRAKIRRKHRRYRKSSRAKRVYRKHKRLTKRIRRRRKGYFIRTASRATVSNLFERIEALFD